jgi:3-hydroxyacyl-CoA dehydrogenase
MTDLSTLSPAAERINPVVSLEVFQTVAVLTIDSPPVNALSQAVRQGVADGLAAALRTPGVAAVVLACAGRTFCAGADIAEFGKPAAEPDLNAVLAAIEASPIAVVAALHGTALGGGLELALACHYRIASPSAKVGLPEVSLGLLPGAGGTQRTPRLIGVAAAVDLIAGGRPIGARQALAAGLIDAIATGEVLLDDAVAHARRLAAEGAPLKRARDAAVDLSAEQAIAVAVAYRLENPRAFVGFKAQANILAAIEAAAALPFDAGLARERELFDELMASDESAAQRHLFFAERAAGKISDLDPAARALDVRRATVVGAGTMGTGIAIALLSSGLSVTLIDKNPDGLARGAERVLRTIRANADKGRISAEQAESQLAALSTATDLAACGSADLVVEAVFERLDLKQEIFAQLDAIVGEEAILASNTSFLDLDAIAAATRRPQRVVGLHFFAPANVMRLLEVVRGRETSDAVIATAMALGRRLGKVAILSDVCDGFIANRAMARRGEAAERLVLEGAMPSDIDRAMKAYGFPMGVFEMLDLVGLDVIGWDQAASAGRTVQEILCEAGHWGQKTGVGYYDYADPRARRPSAAATVAIETIRARRGALTQTFTDVELIERLLDPVVNEGAKLLEEGVVQRASDIDMAMVAGYGWPVYRGGPMFWGDTAGLATVANRLRARRDAGDPITLSPLLERHAREGGRFVRD